MLGIHDLGLFIVSGLLLNILPGPDSLLIMTRSATQGWRACCAAGQRRHKRYTPRPPI